MSQIAAALKTAWEPWMTADLADYADAIGSMFAEVETYTFDRQLADGSIVPGWAVLLDPDLCPPAALPYLAQCVGERLPVGLVDQDEAAAREWIKDAPNQLRGTNYAIFRAAQRKLTGSRLVALYERPGGVVDKIAVTTYTNETPDPAGTLQDILSVLPADVILEYAVADGPTWAGVSSTYATWAAVKAANATWVEVLNTVVGASTFARPRP